MSILSAINIGATTGLIPGDSKKKFFHSSRGIECLKKSEKESVLRDLE